MSIRPGIFYRRSLFLSRTRFQALSQVALLPLYGDFKPGDYQIGIYVRRGKAVVHKAGNLTYRGWGGNYEVVEHLHSGFAADAMQDVAEFFELLSATERVRHGLVRIVRPGCWLPLRSGTKGRRSTCSVPQEGLTIYLSIRMVRQGTSRSIRLPFAPW